MSTSYYYHGKDFYKILRVSHTATAKEIKSAYYDMALQLHPDKHNGCSKKLESFKQVNEAYNVLSDQSKRSEYDFKIGILRYNSSNTNPNRRAAPPKDYRKVYTSHPPPHWKTTWDHVKHQEMHYGEGMQREAIRQAKKTAEEEGAFEYRSPLGKGFTFSNSNDGNFNPYSKRTPQGPPKVVFEYEEGNLGTSSGRAQILRRERIVQEMHARRSERHKRQQEEMVRQQRQAASERYSYNATPPPATSPHYARYSTLHAAAAGGRNRNAPSDDCIIL